MTDQKPKHKPQKKRTLEEVLKSLQDLIRADLVSSAPLQESWRESGRTVPVPRTAASEPESFQNALFKLDQILHEKIIEPVERAQQTPPEPLLPDEEIEIEWNDASEPSVDGKEPAELESADVATFDDAPISLDQEIEIEPMEPDAAPPNQVAVEPKTETPPKRALSESNTEVFSEPGESEPEVEELEATSVEGVENPAAPTPDTIALPEKRDPTKVPDDHQQAFSFAVATITRAVEPQPRPKPAPAQEVRHETKEKPKPPSATEVTANPKARGPDSADAIKQSARKSDARSEQADAHAVEPNNAADADAFTVEFSAAPKTPSPSAPVGTETAESANQRKPDADDAKPPSGKVDVKKKSRSSDSTETAKKASKRRIDDAEMPKTTGEIPILEDVADLNAPPATPLPDTSQARDIAIRVIAKLNIERRKAGEAPLDIKTIERLKQYLADALGKRALNKPK